MKITSHGSKSKNFHESPMPEEVKTIVRDFHLLEFVECSLTMLNAFLLSAFVERWHPEISSFHLSFGEMTITLYDIDQLFHILVAGTLFTPVYINQVTTMCMVVDGLEVSEADVLQEFGEIRGFHLQMSWLRKLYASLVEVCRFWAAARAYILHLVTCTLFADKYEIYIDIRYLCMFNT
ncbi:unnamed protein product [Vicia faba]|uniref:Aminotransferase-like plant mobile domain-containing protein n=1 Tax=Vicia faba TaxID=3906 RepID=A0AAV1A2N9_VICFA|nr:unnamed protein product [Vicia faba]